MADADMKSCSILQILLIEKEEMGRNDSNRSICISCPIKNVAAFSGCWSGCFLKPAQSFNAGFPSTI